MGAGNPWLGGLVFLVLCAAGADVQAGRLTDLSEIIMNKKITEIDGLKASGAEAGVRARIIRTENNSSGNAHGSNSYKIKIQTASGQWSAAHFRGRNGEDKGEEMVEVPHMDEDMVISVRLFRARFDHLPATVAIVAAREITDTTSYYDRAPENVSLYLLTRHSEDGSFAFDLINEFFLKEKYINADCGIAKESNVPLAPRRYGPYSKGCDFDDRKP